MLPVSVQILYSTGEAQASIDILQVRHSQVLYLLHKWTIASVILACIAREKSVILKWWITACVCCKCNITLQWNPSIVDTLGTW